MLYFIEPQSLFYNDQLSEKTLRSYDTGSVRKYAYSMLETTDAYTFSVDVPGIKADDVSITYDDNGTLSIKTTNEKSFTKSFVIDPNTVQVDAIHANVSDGVLKVTAPKPTPRTITVAATSVNEEEASESSSDHNPLTMTLDVPGVRLEDVSITLRDNTLLRIQAVRRRVDRPERVFSKSYSVDPDKFDVSQVNARLGHGVLSVSVPRKPQAEPLAIEIDTPSSADETATASEDKEGHEDSFQVQMDLPGVKKSDVSIQVEDNVLRIRAIRHNHHNSRKKMRLAKETTFDPRRVQRDAFHATLVDGVLTVTAPRIPRPAPKEIPVTNDSPPRLAEEEETTGSEMRDCQIE